jgi:hypothetical protein
MIKRRWAACALLVFGVALSVWACARPTPPGPVRDGETDESAGAAFFEDITASSGVRFTFKNGEETGHLAILESLGGGVALIDYDGDGLLDIFIPGGGYFDRSAKKFRKDGKAPGIHGYGCKLYKNLGGGKFKDVTAKVGLDRLADGPWFFTHGAAVGDFNRDGWPDLLVTGWGSVALFQNVPVDKNDPKKGRKFVDVTAKSGLREGFTWTTSAGWAGFDGDGWPDLYVCQYVDWSFKKHPKCNYDGKTPDVCPPKEFHALPHRVFRNNGDGTFTDVSNEAGLRMPRKPQDYAKLAHLDKLEREALQGAEAAKEYGKGLGVLLVDVDGDGKPDIYVANDTVDKFLYLNCSTPGKIRFKEKGLESGAARDGKANANGSMGLDAGDYDGSGKPALWVTNYEGELHALYGNLCRRGQLDFSFQTGMAGIAALGQKYVGWGTGFLDIDHHGWEDLLVVNGHAIRFPKHTGVMRLQKPVLLRNGKGRFKDISPRVGAYYDKPEGHLARGLALGDLDNDGRVDAVISHMNEPVALLRNVSASGYHWLGVQLVGEKHRDVVGARVRLEAGGRTQTRFAKGGGSYLSSPDRRHVFGLGETATVGKLTVIWPNGKKQHWEGLAVDRYYRLVQGKPQAEVLYRKK